MTASTAAAAAFQTMRWIHRPVRLFAPIFRCMFVLPGAAFVWSAASAKCRFDGLGAFPGTSNLDSVLFVFLSVMA
jgi:hypothetical protein